MARKKQLEKLKKAESLNKDHKEIKIISILFYVLSVLYAIYGIYIMISFNSMIGELSSSIPEIATIDPSTLTAVGVMMGIFLVGLGVLFFFVGRGLWRFKQWARITAIVILSIGLLFTIISIISAFQYLDIARVIIYATLTAYLIFSEKVKKAFA